MSAARLLLAAAMASCVGLVLVAGSDMTAAYQGLAALGLASAAAIAWAPRPATALLCGLVVSAPVLITKGLVARGGSSGPGLELMLADLFLVALIPCWLFELGRGGRGRARGALLGVGVFSLYVAWAWLRGVTADEPFGGMLGALNATRALLVLLAVATLVRDGREVRAVVAAGAAGLLLQTTMVGAQVATGSELAPQGAKIATLGTRVFYEAAGGVTAFRPAGLMLHPNALAAYLVLILPIPFALAVLGPRRLGPRRFRWCLLLLGAGVMALLVTLSRAGWLSMVAAGLFALGLARRADLVSRRRAAMLLLSGVVAVGAAAVIYPVSVYRLTHPDQKSTSSRMLMLDQAGLIISRNPWVGVGYGNYPAAALRYVPSSFESLESDYRDTLAQHVVHNKYLAVWAELGVVGLLLYLAVWWRPLRGVMRSRAWHDPLHHALAIGLAGGLFAQLVFFLLDHFHSESRFLSTWMALGLLAALLRMAPPVPGRAAARA